MSEGYVVTRNGTPTWVCRGQSDAPRIVIYDEVGAARRAVARIVRANAENGVGIDGYAVSRVSLKVEQAGEPWKVLPTPSKPVSKEGQ